MYPPDLVAPMAKDLTDFGFESLNNPDEVIDAIENTEGTLLLVVNSVCGCAAANARPGAKLALSNESKSDRLVTVFAGVDREATGKAREYLLPYKQIARFFSTFFQLLCHASLWKYNGLPRTPNVQDLLVIGFLIHPVHRVNQYQVVPDK